MLNWRDIYIDSIDMCSQAITLKQQREAYIDVKMWQNVGTAVLGFQNADAQGRPLAKD